MRRVAAMFGFTVIGIILGAVANHLVHAQQSSIKRTDVLNTSVAGVEGKQAHMWIADIAPGAATGKHSHPTPRFVYVIAGSIILEVEGESPKTYKAGEGYEEMPNVVHNFRNASATAPAQALGFQIVGNGQALQY